MDEVGEILKLFSTGCAQRTFGSLADEFSNLRKSLAKSEIKDFRLGVCLVILLGDEFNAAQIQTYDSVATLESEADVVREGILSPAGRLAALYLVHHLYNNADTIISQNPFLPFFVEIIDSPQSPSLTQEIEADFLFQLLWKTHELSKVTPGHVIRTYRPTKKQRPDFAPIRKLWEDRKPQELTPFSCHGLRRVLRDPSNRIISEPDSKDHPDLKKELNLQAFEPEFVRPEPDLLPVTEHELRWLDIEDQEEISWDNDDCQNMFKFKRGSELLHAAICNPLSQQQEDELLKHLTENVEQKLKDAQFSNQTLPELIRHNQKIATQIFLALKHTPQISEYYKVLAQMYLTKDYLVHSIQVVTAIANEAPVPSDFAGQFICNCIRSCSEIKDTFFQKMLVRQVCVLIQTLIHTKVINIKKDLFVKISTFCILFSQEKEVTALHRLVRNSVKDTPPEM
jgi:hypothetical protein